jgi:GH15 family glucan-1,4-alpha-glucosidase
VALRIEDYAMIGDCQTAALVGRNGSIDWLCLPRFDSDACFAAILGTPEHGHWTVAPSREPTTVRRAYRDGSMILDTTFETDEGVITLSDFMPIGGQSPQIVRTIRGVRGRVAMHAQLRVRFDYGSVVPWVRKAPGQGILAIAGPDSLRLQSDVPLRGEGLTTVADFEVAANQSVSFVLTWYPSHASEPKDADARALMNATERAWAEWSAHCTYQGEWRPAVLRSLVTLKALTHGATGGIVAAPTTSLPEAIGGVRNWDYRFCWVRDATFTLLALLHNGFEEEALAWREWLLRAVAGDPSKLQIMYAVDGRRRIEERTVPWLPGYEGSSPVRVGNAAFEQRQHDVYGEVMDALHQCTQYGLAPSDDAWDLRRSLLEFLESSWDKPDEGIWEVRGGQRQFTHSKVMAWVAFDRAVGHVEKCGSGGPLERWRAIRDRIHAEVCQHGYDGNLQSFVQSFGSKRLDASLLMIPLVGFLPPTDPRVVGTANAIERDLLEGGLVRRYDSELGMDSLPPGEGAFLPCSFWLADNWALMGRHADARALFGRLVALCNDVGLISEEYDSARGRLVGNFPQAFSHVSLVNTACNLASVDSGPAGRRHTR